MSNNRIVYSLLRGVSGLTLSQEVCQYKTNLNLAVTNYHLKYNTLLNSLRQNSGATLGFYIKFLYDVVSCDFDDCSQLLHRYR